MAGHPKTYMKISGSFSELGLPLTADTEPDYDSLFMKLEPWTDVVFDTFGPERVLFGSDWPICNIGGGGNTVAWQRWAKIVDAIVQRRGLTVEQKAGVFGGVAIKAYGLQFKL
jgi:L-rhamnono-1,4-lactonase